jgi:hypothetical protein
MKNIKNYRIINDQEREEIDRLANNALTTLQIDYSDDNSFILKIMNEFVENYNGNDYEELEKYGYELGSLFGNIIQKEFGWQWFYIDSDDETFYCITSPKEKACCVCHNYFYSILKQDHSNNFRLLFNMIEKEYPKNWKFMVLS